MKQTNINLALAKFSSTVDWKFLCSKANLHDGEGQASADLFLCSRGSAELPAQSLASMTHLQHQTSSCGDMPSRQVPLLQKWFALSHLL